MSNPNKKPIQEVDSFNDDMMSFYKFMEFEKVRKQHEAKKQVALKNNDNDYDDDKERTVIGYLIVILTVVFVVIGYINKFTSEDKPDSFKSISELHYPTKEETRDYMKFLEKQSGENEPPKKFYDDLKVDK